MTQFYRNIPLLAISQALMMSSTSLIITSAALVGFALAEDKSMATLPLAIQFISTMFMSIPASMILKKLGRRRGFMLATLLGMAGGGLGAYAIINNEFWGFVVATALIGAFNAFGIYYRFTAADSVSVDLKAKAISYVMVGGVAAALIGPNLANYMHETIAGAPFAGAYLSVIVLYVLSFFVLAALKLPEITPGSDESVERESRPLREITMQPDFVVAVICGMLGYGIMSFLMTATPLAMDHHQHSFSDTSFVIQWHVLGMFAPSFFTGHLIKKFGVYSIMTVGALLGFAAVVLNLAGTSIPHFWTALFALGLSWNFLFIGASTLLTETYHSVERSKVQAFNEFMVFTTVAIASLMAGKLQYLYGWEWVNKGVIPLLCVVMASLAWGAWRKSKAERITS